MAIIGSLADPEDIKIGSKIAILHIANEQGQPLRTYLSYRLYVNELFQQTQDNLKSRYRQGLISTVTWEDELSAKNHLPLGSCRGLHLISPQRSEVELIASNKHVRQAFLDPASYIEVHFTENRHCTKAFFRQPFREGFTKVIDLLQLIQSEKSKGHNGHAWSHGNARGSGNLGESVQHPRVPSTAPRV